MNYFMKKNIPLILLFILPHCLLTAQTNKDIIQEKLDTSLQNDTADKDRVFQKIEIESSFPGGAAAWIQFLKANLTYPKKAFKKKIEGTVIVRFIVEKDGSLTDVIAISGDDLLREEAVRVLRNSPKWEPAHQNGKIVRSYKKQPLTFKIN